MRGFQQRLPDFNARGIRVAAVSAETPEVLRPHWQKLGFTYPCLCDPQAEVIRRYGLLHAGGAPGGADIARPAEFLLDSTGAVRWMNLTESVTVRARPEQVLKVIDDLKLALPAKP